jgi:hypothetical protein
LQRQEALQLVLPWFAALARDAKAAAKLDLSSGAKAAIMDALVAALSALTPADEAHGQVSMALAVRSAVYSRLACPCQPQALPILHCVLQPLSTVSAHAAQPTALDTLMRRIGTFAGPQAAGAARRALAGAGGAARHNGRALAVAYGSAAAGSAAGRPAADARS